MTLTRVNDIPVFGWPMDQGALDQIIRCAETAEQAALMADHHKGYSVPIGGVLAYDGKVSPNGVGYDIGCGNKAIKLDLTFKDIYEDLDQLMDEIWKTIAFGVGKDNPDKADHPLFDHVLWSDPFLETLKPMARNQLGSIGSGNHFVDLFRGTDGYIWIGVHFGSRGLGHKIATHFLKEGGAKDGMDTMPLLLDTHAPIGDDYLAAMWLAGQYAYAGRDWVCNRVTRILGGGITKVIHNHHNYAWFEDGRYVIRKGATPIYPGTFCFVGGSMGDNSYILKGLNSDAHLTTMFSTVHGAGRTMSRSQATKTIPRQDMINWLETEGVMLRGAGVDEAPQAYKRIDDVIEHHHETVEIVETLAPIGVLMAGGGRREKAENEIAL